MSENRTDPLQKINKDKGFVRSHEKQSYAAGFFLTASLAIYGLMRKGNYSAALRFYPSGGGGLNVYQRQDNGRQHRHFAADYHPIWNKKTKQKEWLPHYHLGKTLSQIKKHRPYEGGFLPPPPKSSK